MSYGELNFIFLAIAGIATWIIKSKYRCFTTPIVMLPMLVLTAVFDNLIGNAWKYSSDAKAPVIEFGSIRGAGGRTEYFVRDNGVGFDMQYAGKLSDRKSVV